MSEVKRYDISAFGGMSMDECRDGAYVNYDDYAALQAKCAAMAAESTRLKSAVTQQIELRAEIKKAGRPPHADFWVQSICEAEEKVKRALEEIPATDALLDEVRAQGVEMFGQYHNFSEKLFIQKEAQKFAAQLRKGVDKK